MKTMNDYAREYQHKNQNKGTVSNITDYSFKFTTTPKNGEKPVECVIMKSYFLNFK